MARTRRTGRRTCEKDPRIKWTVEQKARNIFCVRTKWEPGRDWEQWVLLTSDRHWDNPHSDHQLQKEHLDEALERGAAIVDIGDLFCLMQGKYDPRHLKRDVRPEHNVDNYIDAVVDDAADFFAPYARNFVCVGMGNHEYHILKRLETNPTERFCKQLHTLTGQQVFNGQYGGWVRFLFDRGGGGSFGLTLRYHHGYGGGGPVTKGTIQHNRRAAFIDADIIATGHIHEKWALSIEKEGITSHCVYYRRRQLHICTGTYKDDYEDGALSWEANRGQPPKPQGGYWLRFSQGRKSTLREKDGGGEARIVEVKAIDTN